MAQLKPKLLLFLNFVAQLKPKLLLCLNFFGPVEAKTVAISVFFGPVKTKTVAFTFILLLLLLLLLLLQLLLVLQLQLLLQLLLLCTTEDHIQSGKITFQRPKFQKCRDENLINLLLLFVQKVTSKQTLPFPSFLPSSLPFLLSTVMSQRWIRDPQKDTLLSSKKKWTKKKKKSEGGGVY